MFKMEFFLPEIQSGVKLNYEKPRELGLGESCYLSKCLFSFTANFIFVFNPSQGLVLFSAAPPAAWAPQLQYQMILN